MPFMKNKVVEAYKEGRKSYGLYLHNPSKSVIQIMAAAGMDFVRLDLEGGICDLEHLGDLIMVARACGITPFVRIHPLDRVLIKRVVSMGAMGIQLPEITSHKDIEYAVMAAKTPPLGRFNPAGSPFGGYGSSVRQYTEWAAENLVVSVQVERSEAIDDLDAILRVPGLDMVCSGRGSMARSFGIPSQYHPDIIEKERQVMTRVIAAGKIASVCYSVMNDDGLFENIREYGQMGVSAFALGGDTAIPTVLRGLIQRANGFFD